MGMLTFRRYRLLKAQAAAARGETALELAHRGVQRSQPGTPLPENFISSKVRGLLVGAGYECIEDLNGATVEELEKINGIASKTAQRILDEIAILTNSQPQ